jgi:hypothetical protein
MEDSLHQGLSRQHQQLKPTIDLIHLCREKRRIVPALNRSN